MKATSPQWVVECPAMTVGPLPSRDAAERRLAAIEELGACMFSHEVREAVAHAEPAA